MTLFVLVPVVALAGSSHDRAAHMKEMKGSSCTCARSSVTTTDEARALAGRRLPSEASLKPRPSIPGTTDEARLIAGSQLPRSERSAPKSIPVISNTDEARGVAGGVLAVGPAPARQVVAMSSNSARAEALATGSSRCGRGPDGPLRVPALAVLWLLPDPGTKEAPAEASCHALDRVGEQRRYRVRVIPAQSACTPRR